jgi:hypothetical protein
LETYCQMWVTVFTFRSGSSVKTSYELEFSPRTSDKVSIVSHLTDVAARPLAPSAAHGMAGQLRMRECTLVTVYRLTLAVQ